MFTNCNQTELRLRSFVKSLDGNKNHHKYCKLLTSTTLVVVDSSVLSAGFSSSVFSSVSPVLAASGLAALADLLNMDVMFFRDQFLSVPFFETSW